MGGELSLRRDFVQESLPSLTLNASFMTRFVKNLFFLMQGIRSYGLSMQMRRF